MASNAFQIPQATLEQQFAASDPRNSSWVSANAGSGKTHVLTQRVIRLLLNGTQPDRILCITFTKAAAANMKTRVFGTLSQWTMLSDQDLDDAIFGLSGVRPSQKLRKNARRLFAAALDTPGGLKIQTIHAFCESLLHQFPLEANVPGHFETLEELQQANLIAQARQHVLAQDHYNGVDITHHYSALVSLANDKAIEDGLSALIANRHTFLRWFNGDLETATGKLREHLEIDNGETTDSVQQLLLLELGTYETELFRIKKLCDASTASTDKKFSNALSVFFNSASPNQKFDALIACFLRKDQTIGATDRLVTKSVKDEYPEAIEIIHQCALKCFSAVERLKAIALVERSQHLFSLGYAILERYEALKRSRGLIDFEDQIAKCANLLMRNEIQDWIRYRLDRGIDHILVDEAQDTSPIQWEIINAITADFHSGDGASKEARTSFVVGDEKQSIFSFQGAVPAEFDRQERQLKKQVVGSGKPFHSGRLALSFRSTPDVLHAVDRVFETDINAQGLTQSGEPPVHDAIRSAHPGEVQIWPLFAKEKQEETKSWIDPVDTMEERDPAVLLADRISDAIGEWVGKPLPGMDRNLQYKDCLVLVRKRDRFITALTRKMKEKELEVAGADRLRLTDHIAVEDMIAIGRFALMPEDDLSLACVLKGVLFNTSEDELLELCSTRGEFSLYGWLQHIACDADYRLASKASSISDALRKLILLARNTDPFIFYASLLGEFGMRCKMLSRFGAEAEDVIDSFLEEAMNFTRRRGEGLETFISEITGAEPEIKREVELDRDEVRIMTVHASKGLEARLVFLVDPCNEIWNSKHAPKLRAFGNGSYGWVSDKSVEPQSVADELETLRLDAEAEYKRLLYVGMTRAADRLVVCGFHGTREPKHQHWHKMVADALCGNADEMRNSQGEFLGWRWTEGDKPPVALLESVASREDTFSPRELPSWLTTPAVREAPLPRPLSPSGAHAVLSKDEQTHFALNSIDSEFALERGNAIHKLLEHVFELAPEKREEACRIYLKKVGREWTEIQREDVWRQVKQVSEHALLEKIQPDMTQNEVSVAGKLVIGGRQITVSGQIDKLLIRDNEVIVLDYKTNWKVPASTDDIPESYITQLMLYREMIRNLYPAKEIVCMILWTKSPLLQQIPNEVLDNSFTLFNNS